MEFWFLVEETYVQNRKFLIKLFSMLNVLFCLFKWYIYKPHFATFLFIDVSIDNFDKDYEIILLMLI